MEMLELTQWGWGKAHDQCTLVTAIRNWMFNSKLDSTGEIGFLKEFILFFYQFHFGTNSELESILKW